MGLVYPIHSLDHLLGGDLPTPEAVGEGAGKFAARNTLEGIRQRLSDDYRKARIEEAYRMRKEG